MQTLMIRIGNFFFRYRNRVFPLIILALFVLAVPPAEIFASHELEEAKDIAAMLMAFAGLWVRALVIGFVYIKRGGMNKKVYAENLVTDGIFGLCRNPLYLGNLLIYAGVFLMHGNLEVILIGTAAYFCIYQCIVRAEEAYLLSKFGDGYRAYCRDVPRWLPILSRFKESTRGMRFNVRRVIMKDYTTLSITVITLALTEGYEDLSDPGGLRAEGNEPWLVAVIVATIAMAAVVRTLKKRKWLREMPVA